MSASTEPETMELDELRSLRTELQHEDDVVSYTRRIAQARIDLVRARSAFLDDPTTVWDTTDRLTEILAQHLTSSEARPPRAVTDVENDPIADELDSLCADNGFSRLEDLDREQLDALELRLTEFERRLSENRRDRHAVIDRLTQELIRRYRENYGGAT